MSQTAFAKKTATVHDAFWDFISLMPQSMHLVMWFMSDRAEPPSPQTVEGFRAPSVRGVRAHGAADYYTQARLFYRCQPPHDQARIICGLVAQLSQVHRPLRAAMVGHLRHVDEGFAKRVAQGLAMDVMPMAATFEAPMARRDVAREVA